MDRVIELTETVRREVADYNNVQAWKARSFYLEDADQYIYAVVDVPANDHPLVQKPGIVVMARVVGDKVVIDEDITDRPLYKELMRAGVPREQIILAYAGEQPPDQKEADHE